MQTHLNFLPTPSSTYSRPPLSSIMRSGEYNAHIYMGLRTSSLNF